MNQLGVKVDLHTHSYGSPDGGLSVRDYRYFLENQLLDTIAITDHDRIDTAQHIQRQLGGLGSRIIIGQEVTTTAGELIGLYLSRRVPAGLTPLAAVKAIREQGGIVLVPHPFETLRSGLPLADLETIAADVSIVEICNGRAVFQNYGTRARRWASAHDVAMSASSDAHGRFGWGRTYSVLSSQPTRTTLVALLRQAAYVTGTVGGGIVYPKFNRLRRRLLRGTV